MQGTGFVMGDGLMLVGFGVNHESGVKPGVDTGKYLTPGDT
jgi:hypothetical protein